jgi:hypothetical protein
LVVAASGQRVGELVTVLTGEGMRSVSRERL